MKGKVININDRIVHLKAVKPIENTNSIIGKLHEFFKESMVEGVDYGQIDGYSKPTLLKPGAEKLCLFYGLSKSLKVTHRLEDWDKGLFFYEVIVTLFNKTNHQQVFEGIGSCNSKETAFQDQEAYSIVNTVLKMAKKRALIDAVLTATQSSGLFTQDIEELKHDNPIKRGNKLVTKRQLNTIFSIVKEIDMHPQTAKAMIHKMFQVDHSTKLTKVQASKFIQDLLLLKQ